MFELSIACKYLIPRSKQLSVSIISVISTLVIALVVWLVVVFFSVKEGLESDWINKIVALTAPIRIIPTEEYYRSYYYLVDTMSASSDYAAKSIAEKLVAPVADPYDTGYDQELPAHWAAVDLDEEGGLKDLVKIAFLQARSLSGIEGLKVTDFETTVVNLHLQLARTLQGAKQTEQALDQTLFIGSFDSDSASIAKVLMPLTEGDFKNLQGAGKNVEVAKAHDVGITMPFPSDGEPILLPKGFKESGVLVGDVGYLSYYLPTPSAVQEQRVPVVVVGFYDPGIIPIGGKYVLASRNLTALVRASYAGLDAYFSNGINVRFQDIAKAPKIKAKLQEAFQKTGIAPYWRIETYQEYEFSKDIIQQLQSEKNLFSVIALIIVIVACSNIISMLIILVNDKKLEIGILRSMGATSASIAMIFGVCGMVMGAVGSLLGVFVAIFTLRYVNELVGFISELQGHELFNPLFYGKTLPTALSLEALMFVIAATVVISLSAGLVPAFKASMMRPSAILRAE